MIYIDWIQPEQANAAVCDMYLRQARPYGYIPNYAKAFSHRPELMDIWAAMLKDIKSRMSDRMFVLVTFAAARALKSSSCSLAFGKRLLTYFSKEEVLTLTRGHLEMVVTSAEALAMRYAAEVATDATTVRTYTISSLKSAGLSDAEIFDIASAAAARAFFTKVLDGVGTHPEEGLAELDPELVEALVVGRPIKGR